MYGNSIGCVSDHWVSVSSWQQYRHLNNAPNPSGNIKTIYQNNYIISKHQMQIASKNTNQDTSQLIKTLRASSHFWKKASIKNDSHLPCQKGLPIFELYVNFVSNFSFLSTCRDTKYLKFFGTEVRHLYDSLKTSRSNWLDGLLPFQQFAVSSWVLLLPCDQAYAPIATRIFYSQ